MAHHARASSDDTSSSFTTGGSSYQLILEHVLCHPGTYEIPLRNMYHLNCLPASAISRPGTPPGNPRSPSPEDITSAQAATSQFAASLLHQITRLPSQPGSLPPAFINSFLRRCFSRELNLVDFPQALTALDYLKDLEFRRRRDHEAALSRLGIGATELAGELAGFEQCIRDWTSQMETHERKIEALYSNLYVALRRWVLINELMIAPFSRHNCLAMLNTLYPPVTASQPTSKLTPDILKRQRQGFFSYIQAVERKGPTVLRPLMDQNKNEGDDNGWPKVRDNLDKYLRVAMTLIEQYSQVTSASNMITSHREQEERRKRKEKGDSGVSFASVGVEGRPSTSAEKRKSPPSPAQTQSMPLGEKRNYSTLEKIARELRKFKDNRKRSGTMDSMDKENEVAQPGVTRSFQSTASAPVPLTTHLSNDQQSPPTVTRIANSLRKIKSLGDVRVARNAHLRNAPAVPSLPFNIDSDRGSMDILRSGFRKPHQEVYEF